MWLRWQRSGGSAFAAFARRSGLEKSYEDPVGCYVDLRLHLSTSEWVDWLMFAAGHLSDFRKQNPMHVMPRPSSLFVPIHEWDDEAIHEHYGAHVALLGLNETESLALESACEAWLERHDPARLHDGCV